MDRKDAAIKLTAIEIGGGVLMEGGVDIDRTGPEAFTWTVNGNTAHLTIEEAVDRMEGYKEETEITFFTAKQLQHQAEMIEVDDIVAAELAGKSDGFPKEEAMTEPTQTQKIASAVQVAAHKLFVEGIDANKATKDQALNALLGDYEPQGNERRKFVTAWNKTVGSFPEPKREEEPKPEARKLTPKKATANPEKKHQSRSKKASEKKPPKPRNVWSILVMDESGETVADEAVKEQPFSAFEGGSKGFDAKKAETIAKYPDRVVRTINVTTGKEYVRRPRKAKASK